MRSELRPIQPTGGTNIMTLSAFITGLEDWIESLETYDENISPLDCCSHRELETVQDILETAKLIKETHVN